MLLSFVKEYLCKLVFLEFNLCKFYLSSKVSFSKVGTMLLVWVLPLNAAHNSTKKRFL